MPKLSGALTLSPSTVAAGDMFDVRGTGFDTAYGNVIVGFTGGGWGSPLSADGSFTIAGIPALSGDSLPAGVYPVTGSQKIRKRWVQAATASLTVI